MADLARTTPDVSLLLLLTLFSHNFKKSLHISLLSRIMKVIIRAIKARFLSQVTNGQTHISFPNDLPSRGRLHLSYTEVCVRAAPAASEQYKSRAEMREK